MPKIPKEWEGYSFKINFRNQILKVAVNQNETVFSLEGAVERGRDHAPDEGFARRQLPLAVSLAE